MSARLHDAFEVCLAALSTGAKLEACLSLYPDLADELRPLLITAQQAQQAARREVPITAMNRSRAKLIAHAGELRRQSQPISRLFAVPRLAFATLAILVVFFLSINGLIVVSAKSLPGDTLYPVKLAAENVSLKLAPSDELRQKMTEDYQQRRAEEVRSLLAQNLVRKIALEGVVSQVTPDGVLIDDIPVALDPQTRVSGNLLPGRLVKLEGVTQPGGFVRADSIQLRFYEYAGVLKAIQRDVWVIDETSFRILDGTRTDPALRIGDRVLVLVYAGDDGRLFAQAILRLPESFSNPTRFEPFEIEFNGVIEAISGDMITVNGKSVQINRETEIKGDITIGAEVKIHARVAEDGSLTATEIKPASGADTAVDDNRKDSDDHSGSESDDDSDSDSDKSDDDQSGDDHSSDDKNSQDDSSGSQRNEDDKSEDDKDNEDSYRSGDSKSDDDHKKDDSRDSDSHDKEEDHDEDKEGSGIINAIAYLETLL